MVSMPLPQTHTKKNHEMKSYDWWPKWISSAEIMMMALKSNLQTIKSFNTQFTYLVAFAFVVINALMHLIMELPLPNANIKRFSLANVVKYIVAIEFNSVVVCIFEFISFSIFNIFFHWVVRINIVRSSTQIFQRKLLFIFKRKKNGKKLEKNPNGICAPRFFFYQLWKSIESLRLS